MQGATCQASLGALRTAPGRRRIGPVRSQNGVRIRGSDNFRESRPVTGTPGLRIQVGHGTCNLEEVDMGIERGDAVMRRFHRQDLQRVEPLRTGVALYFLQQSLPRTR